MNKLNRLLLPLVLGAITLSAQVATSPVGYRTDTIAAGNVPYAPTFVNADSASGSIGGVTVNTDNAVITFTGSALTVDAYNEGTTFPNYYVEVTSGTNEGYSFDVISNTADSITVAGDLSSFNLSTESIVIREHLTVGDIFAGSSASLAAYADSVKFFNNDGTTTVFYWIGTGWSSDFATDESDKPVYPGTGFIATFASSVELVVSGSVKTTKTKVPVYAGLVNFVSSMQPSDTTAGGFNGVEAFAAYADSLKTFNSDGSLSQDKVYYSISTSMSSDFVNDESADFVSGANSPLVTVGQNKYMTMPAAFAASGN